VRDAIDAAFKAAYLELAPDSAPWPCDVVAAGAVRLRVREAAPPTPPEPQPVREGVTAEADLGVYELQELAETAADLLNIAAGYDIRFRLRIQVGGSESPPPEVVARLNERLVEVSKELKLT